MNVLTTLSLLVGFCGICAFYGSLVASSLYLVLRASLISPRIYALSIFNMLPPPAASGCSRHRRPHAPTPARKPRLAGLQAWRRMHRGSLCAGGGSLDHTSQSASESLLGVCKGRRGCFARAVSLVITYRTTTSSHQLFRGLDDTLSALIHCTAVAYSW